MKTILFVGLCTFCLVTCSSQPHFYPRDPSPAYGDPLPGTIDVVAWHGFKRQGHYHLPRGATLGLLVDVAGWIPKPDGVVIGKIRFGLETTYMLRVIHEHDRDHDGRQDAYHTWLDEKGMPSRYRDRQLFDGDVVRQSSITF